MQFLNIIFSLFSQCAELLIIFVLADDHLSQFFMYSYFKLLMLSYHR